MIAAGGELAYNDQLEDQTKLWLRQNSEAAITILLRHIREYIFPPIWVMKAWDRGGVDLEPRRLFMGLAALLSLVAMPLLIWRDRRFLYVYVAMFALAAPYVIVQPLLRYRYLISTLTIFIACHAVALALTWLWSKRAQHVALAGD